MDFWMALVAIVGMSTGYDVYKKKKEADLKMKELEVEKRRIELEMRKSKKDQLKIVDVIEHPKGNDKE